jgi:hypothetical protein
MRRNRFCGSVSWARSRSSITGRYEWYSTMHLALTCEDDELMNIVEELYVKAFQATKHETDVIRIDSLQELQLSSKNSPILPSQGHDLQPIGFKSNRSKNKRPGRRGTPQCAFCQKNKRGKCTPCIRKPHRPGVPCEPCRKKGYDAKQCGDRTFGPSGPKETFDAFENVVIGNTPASPTIVDSVSIEDRRLISMQGWGIPRRLKSLLDAMQPDNL